MEAAQVVTALDHQRCGGRKHIGELVAELLEKRWPAIHRPWLPAHLLQGGSADAGAKPLGCGDEGDQPGGWVVIFGPRRSHSTGRCCSASAAAKLSVGR